jgi:protein-S-isoprenylcysteine O-methyltransferase Ste14
LTRLPGDPGPLGWLRFAFGFRMPAKNVHWVRHELTDAGWRWRTVVRHLVVILPVCAVVVVVLEVLLPTPAWVSVMMVVLILCGSVFGVAAYADDIRAARLRQHGLPVPKDRDLGRPTH